MQISKKLPSSFATVRQGVKVPFGLPNALGGLISADYYHMYCKWELDEELCQPVEFELALVEGSLCEIDGEEFVKAQALHKGERRAGLRVVLSPAGKWSHQENHLEKFLWVRVADLEFTKLEQGLDFEQESQAERLVSQAAEKNRRRRGTRVAKPMGNALFRRYSEY